MLWTSVGTGSKKGGRAGTGNATSLKIGQGHLRAMPTFQRWGTGINIAGIGHFWAIDNDKIWAFPGSRKKKTDPCLTQVFQGSKMHFKVHSTMIIEHSWSNCLFANLTFLWIQHKFTFMWHAHKCPWAARAFFSGTGIRGQCPFSEKRAVGISGHLMA